jgi:hypothetical protein
MTLTEKHIKQAVINWIADNYGEGEAANPAYNIDALSKHLANGDNYIGGKG